MDGVKPLGWIKTDTTRLEHAVKAEKGQSKEAEAQEGIDYGVVVLPPVMGTENAEVDSYPADYIEYCQDRLRAYKEKTGELPKYETIEAPDLPPELLQQAEEASRVFNAQAEEANTAMEE